MDDLRIRRDRDRFVAFSFAAADVLFELDEAGAIVFASGATKGLFGTDTEAITRIAFLDLLHPADRRTVDFAIRSLQPGHRLEPMRVRPNGSEVAVLLGGCRLGEPDNHCFVTFSANNSSIDDVDPSQVDAETGLLNRDSFLRRAQEQRRVAAKSKRSSAINLLDITGLDSLGAEKSEEETAKFLSDLGSLMRANAIGGALAGRLGDSKFAVLSGENAVAGDIERGFNELVAESGGGGALSLSSAQVSLDGKGLSDDQSARALIFTINSFARSAPGEFSISDLDGAWKNEALANLRRGAELKKMFDSGAFNIVFQPIVDLKSRVPHHFEVLTRFEGDSSPYQDIVFAEDIGLILELDLAVCRKAIDYLKGCDTAVAPNLAINLSARSLSSDGFVDKLLGELEQFGEDHKSISFEVTESTEIDNLDRMNQILGRLRGLGYQVGLDDFGAGAASLSYIQALEIDIVKLDGKYIRKMIDSPRDRAILRSMAVLCEELGVKTVAEMVETEEQAVSLADIGITYGQGWLFGKPIPTVPAPPVSSASARVDRAWRRRSIA
ncbi:EAL domain-containing protein [Oceanibacterium hippocampi]|uniref:Putative membrane protein YjcC n=1 Tax=Oceanibacterium hippocampi TaxID=745714 RepID=A0A1Y5SUG7_9PROT|nr:sensor domain-containing phosphodiesterase [Oceanibacterium hippocampi]SLN48807.1 putative membrane protein YjcC [Oceanibacterium hippocampi]